MQTTNNTNGIVTLNGALNGTPANIASAVNDASNCTAGGRRFNPVNTDLTAKECRAIDKASIDQYDEESTDPNSLRMRFIDALKANASTYGTLAKIVAEAISEGFDRDDCIQWGLESGLSESHVRSTVSRLFGEVQGKKNSAGQGRKTNVGAEALWNRVLNSQECDGNIGKALSLLRAAVRIGEKVQKASVKADKASRK